MKYLACALVFLGALSVATIPVSAQSSSREELLNALQAKRQQLQELEQLFLAPPAEDQEAYAAFLALPETGLIRLLPRERYDSEANKKSGKTLSIRGGGAYYSFQRLTHEYGYGSDIQLEDGQLSVGFAGASYGMLLNLGDVSIDEITLEHPRVTYLASYDPPKQEVNARSEARQFGKGISAGDKQYSNRVPAVVNNTYLLRSIDYSRSDVLVVFRVIRKDTDGSVVLAWRMLKKYPVPTLARAN